jgi:hypothetical protein
MTWAGAMLNIENEEEAMEIPTRLVTILAIQMNHLD